MTTDPSGAEPDRMLAAERDIQQKLGDLPLDFDAQQAISNIYRATSAVRRRAETEVLGEYNLSWGGLTILWVLWIWGDMETGQLAAECDLAKGTLTGMLTTLEKQGRTTRTRLASDKRRVMVALTPDGEQTISTLFPRFNAFEAEMTAGLSVTETRELARLLRIVTRNASSADASPASLARLVPND